ncbi:MAG: D-alanine--D-alanine ligase [Burkholderiaceae bacterium]|jgi:D-alanine-D-alanine ligase|nr:D-alanine--D-alanine ligase [Burkholderiaceae bacterium]
MTAKRQFVSGKVGVLLGGKSAEREVSLKSGTGVLQALKRKGVDAHPFDPSDQPLAALEQAQFERVFIALHGRYGEDGSIQGVLEQLRIPYTGSGIMASAIAMDKLMTKRIWMTENLPTPRFIEINAHTDWSSLADTLGLPLIVKPAHEGSTLGLSRVSTPDQLPAAYALASKYDSCVFAEAFVDGKELTCAILDVAGKPTALPLIRIIAPNANYDYQNKYFGNQTRYLCPSGLSPALETRIQQDVLASYRALGCRGWGRVDVMLRARDEQHFLLEMNSSPGMTEHSLVPMAAREAGMTYEELCMTILAGAQLELPDRIG